MTYDLKALSICTGEPQSNVSLRFVGLIKQYMDRQWTAADDANDVQQASHQDACWDMSVLQACLDEQQRAWAALPPRPVAQGRGDDATADASIPDASEQRRRDGIQLLEQVPKCPMQCISFTAPSMVP